MYNLTSLSIWSSMSHLIHEIFADDVITQCVKIIKKRNNLRREDIFLRLLWSVRWDWD